MLLTQAFSRHIIGVATEQLYCTEAKNKNHSKNSTIKTTVPRRRLFFITPKDTTQAKTAARAVYIYGGAGGYCPRVQTVTYYSSTNIVDFKIYMS